MNNNCVIKEQPLVTIVVPCYKQSVFLSEALDSVLDQTYENWECIIVDDGSPDNTGEVAQKYCKRDLRFKYYYKENGGLSSARNAGIKAGIGKYILPLDADDKIGVEYIKLGVDILEKYPNVKIVYCREELFGWKSGECELESYSMELMLCRNLIFCSGIFRRLDYNKTVGYNENMRYGFEDWDFWLSLLEQGGDVFKIDRILFFYRIKKNSMIISLDTTKQELMRYQIWENHKDLYARYFLNPCKCFEYVNLVNSKEYKLGKLILTPILKTYKKLCLLKFW